MEERLRKTILTILFAIAALMCLLALSAAAESLSLTATESIPVDLAIAPDDTLVVRGHIFQLRVQIDTDSTDFMGYNLTVCYDSLRLNVVSVDEGPFPKEEGQ